MDPSRLTFDTAWSPELDTHGDPPKNSLAILSTPRTGSQTLCRLLYAMGLGVPAEYFLKDVMDHFSNRFLGGAATSSATFARSYIEAIQTSRCRNGWVSYKVHADQHRQLTADLGEAWEHLQPNLIMIRLRRRNIVDQVVSLGAAFQTGIWDDGADELIKRPGVLNEAVAERWTEYIFRSERYWDRYLGSTPHRLINLFCEDLRDGQKVANALEQLSSGHSREDIEAILSRLPRYSRNRELSQALTQRFGEHIARHWQALSQKAG